MSEIKRCQGCGVVTDKLYRYRNDRQDIPEEKIYCLLCLERLTDELPTDSLVGWFGVKRNPHACFALLKRAMIHALNSDDETQRNKAKLVLKKMSETSAIIADTYGSCRSDDLRDVLHRQKRLVLIDSEEDIQRHTAEEKDNLPDVKLWPEIYARSIKNGRND